jgi:hypothetical protein
LYYEDGITPRYIGPFKDGQFHGQGKAYHLDSTLAYDGRFVQGRPIDHPDPRTAQTKCRVPGAARGKKGGITEWKKYFEGEFNEPGLGGK